MFEIRLSNAAKKQYFELEPKLRSRVDVIFACLTSNPVSYLVYDVRKLKGYENAYRIRVSSRRITYRIYSNERAIRIESIERRDEHTYD